MPGEIEKPQTVRRLIVVGVVWIVVTALAELWAIGHDWHPFGASREARITDDAFDFLVLAAVPVFTFVLVMATYSLIRDRAKNDHDDGPPIRTNRMFITAWMVITSALSVLVIITPGFSGLDELRAEPNPDLIIDVRAERWNWAYTYAESGYETQDALTLPVDRRILFRISSTDVIHSFWIPAFRIKQDAVPGQITTTMVTPEELGNFDNADEMRVQCAELCGVGHARMWTGVSVVTQAEFDDWLAQRAGG